MLNLDHPMTQHIFAASRAEDAILIAAKLMTAVSRQESAQLQAGFATAFAELRRLSRDHFADCTAIPATIDVLEQALAQLAASRAATGPRPECKCPTCSGNLGQCPSSVFWGPGDPTTVYCSACLQMIMPFLQLLRWWEQGFGTDAI